jgi:hypothetical protein
VVVESTVDDVQTGSDGRTHAVNVPRTNKPGDPSPSLL